VIQTAAEKWRQTRGLNERKRILGTRCEICLRLSSMMKWGRKCEGELDDVMSWEVG